MDVILRYLLSTALVAILFGGAEPFGRGHYEEHFSEIILNLDLWFRRRCRRRCCLMLISRALVAILFFGAKPFWQGALGETFL